MGLIKGMIGIIAATPLAGAAMSGIGTTFGAIGGGVAGIGVAAQSLVGVGFVGHAIKSSGVKDMFKW